MRVDEIAIQVNRLLVVLGGLSKLPLDKVELGTVVVDIRIVAILL